MSGYFPEPGKYAVLTKGKADIYGNGNNILLRDNVRRMPGVHSLRA